MAEPIGSLYYEVTLDTRKMVDGQREAERVVERTKGSLDSIGATLNQVTRAITAYAAAAYLISQSDAYTKLNAQLKLATNSTRELAAAQQQVRQIASEAQADISSLGMLYARITNATAELGVSQQRVSDITRVVALSLKVSGATAAETGSAMLQLSQAFASGTLRGEEFNAVNEAAPRLMKALADGIGVPTGQLRALAEAGKLTSEVLAEALPRALSSLEQEAKAVQTISGAFQQLKNEVMLFVGEQTTSSGAAKATADAITLLASNIDVLVSAVYGFAAAKLADIMISIGSATAGSVRATMESILAQRASTAAAVTDTAARLEQLKAAQAGLVVARAEAVATLASANAKGLAAGAALRNVAATLQEGAVTERTIRATLDLAAANRVRSASLAELAVLGRQQASVTAAMTAAQAAHTAALGAASTAATLASRVLGFLGGPIGAITTVLGLGVTAWALWGGEAKASAEKAAGAMEKSTAEIVSDLDRQIAKLKERNKLSAAGLPSIAKQDTEAARQLATLQGQIDNLMSGKGLDGGAPLPEAARVGLLQTLLAQYGTLAGKIAEVGVEQKKLDDAGKDSKLTTWMAKYASDTEKVAAEIKKAKAELGDAFTPELEQRIRQKFMPDKAGPKPPKDRFDEGAYLAGLEKATLDGIERVDAMEREALRKNAELLKQKKISAEQAAKAVTLIETNAAQERRDIQLRNAEDIRSAIEQGGKEEAAAAQQRAAIAERIAQTSAETQIAAATDELTRIDLLRQESLRRAEAAYRAGAISFAQAEADKTRAAVDAQNAIRQQVLSVNPLAQLQRDYEAKLAIVRFYEQQMAQAGVDGAAFVEAKRTELARQYQQQRQALAEAEFAWQSEGNKFLIDSINALSTTATQSITGLLNGTMSATDAVRGLAGVVLNEAVGALVQMGAQYVKNALIGQAADKALLASKAANAAIYTAAITAQVGVNTALAAQAAFASTAAIPIIGPALAPAAAAAAAAAAGAIGAPAAALAPIAGNRQYGGPVSAGSLYQVNETGQPEMFTASTGAQFMLPTASGKVTAADKVGASRAPTVIIQNMGNPVAVQSQSWDQQTNTMRVTLAEAARQIREREGPMWAALGTTNVRGQV